MKTNINGIISKFISKEVEAIYSRYNSIPEVEINTIRNFIDKVEENDVAFDPYLSYSATKAVAEVCTQIEDIDFLKFYVVLRSDLRLDVEIDDAQESYIYLKEQGYCKVQGNFLYTDNDIMKELAKDELDTKLQDAYQLAIMFSIEVIADMWIFATSKEEASEQYLKNNNWWSVLECEEPEEGYTDSNGKTIYYCYKSEV
ncbi:hypothetical protein K9O30_01665 [Clostridium bowmanii]|uniref:hypothetical protein n=1 Tax=Clostridium bowmanii TaxID=132925 RepID=UPI001C0CC3BE|nr:hypothetical protein [Clostridium bowmanii]MBU3190323.1 hypothetical protein [Clostridium bowmanii]MCA1072465.1 hypothetical protein [Clostridium bowmanii]